jgi:hypothetical protein
LRDSRKSYADTDICLDPTRWLCSASLRPKKAAAMLKRWSGAGNVSNPTTSIPWLDACVMSALIEYSWPA